MADRPKVSVVMPVHNGGAYLAAAIESILEQTLADLEFVIVDDGSTDATADTIRRYQAADRRVRPFRQPKSGMVAALTLGCREARAEYIARMDADDMAFPQRLERQMEFLERHPEVVALGGGCVRIDAEGRKGKREVYPTSHAAIVQGLRRYTCMLHPAVTLRAQALAAAGGYRAAYVAAEDLDLWLRLSEHGELANLAEPLVYLRLYAGQVSVRHLEQQILSCVAAREAARRRQAGHPDPTADCHRITREVLRGWDIPDAAVDEAIGEGYRYAAHVMRQNGRHGEAIGLLRVGCDASRGRGRLDVMLAGACARQARVAFRHGRMADALLWGLEALRVRPSLPLELIRAARNGRNGRGHSEAGVHP
jgi:hypothetical protein